MDNLQTPPKPKKDLSDTIQNTNEVGYVTKVRNFLVTLSGLPTIRINDLVENEEGVRGVVAGLHPNTVDVLTLDEGEVYPGQLFKKMDKNLSIILNQSILGRAINPLGVPIDGKKFIKSDFSEEPFALDAQATGISSREFIDQQFITGITLIDSLIPIGKGQRELILGDAHSGKTGFLIDLIINQQNQDVFCIFASIGKPIAQVKNLIDTLQTTKAIEHTVVIAASSSEPAPLIFLTPQTAFGLAEYFQHQGKDVLLILDDLGNHAKIYREIALLAGRPPGRESYPGDIFYQHAHLIERAGRFNLSQGGGSITCFPVMEINLDDFTTYIPTNLMSMTDGHLMFKASLHNKGQNPAIDIPLSVSRVGRQTQNRIINALSQKIRQLLAHAQEIENVANFSAELPYETRLVIHQKDLIYEILRQPALTYFSLEVQTILLSLVFTSYLLDKDLSYLQKYKTNLVEYFQKDATLSQMTKQALNSESVDLLVKELEKQVPNLKKLCP